LKIPGVSHPHGVTHPKNFRTKEEGQDKNPAPY